MPHLYGSNLAHCRVLVEHFALLWDVPEHSRCLKALKCAAWNYCNNFRHTVDLTFRLIRLFGMVLVVRGEPVPVQTNDAAWVLIVQGFKYNHIKENPCMHR